MLPRRSAIIAAQRSAKPPRASNRASMAADGDVASRASTQRSPIVLSLPSTAARPREPAAGRRRERVDAPPEQLERARIGRAQRGAEGDVEHAQRRGGGRRDRGRRGVAIAGRGFESAPGGPARRASAGGIAVAIEPEG